MNEYNDRSMNASINVRVRFIRFALLKTSNAKRFEHKKDAFLFGKRRRYRIISTGGRGRTDTPEGTRF